MAKKINIVANLIDWQFKKQLKDLQNGKYNVNVNVNGTGLKNANAQMRQLGSTTQNTNTVFGKLRNTISNTFSSGKIAMTSYLVVLNEINKAAREAKDTILEMDKAVTDLSVAMNGTREEASEYVKVLNKQAIDLKTTTKSVTDASDAWLRQGKSIKETETLIRDSLVLSKVGKIESADATDYLTSALNGYKLEAEDAIAVIDKLTAVDAESASEAGGLALSMSRTASAADMAGVSMDKLIGWLSVVKEVTRDSDEAVGNMAKTMLSRMNQVKADKFIDAETGESLNDMEKVLNKVGVALRDANGQFISSEIVLDELGKKFNEFDSVTQRAIATQLGGTYQYEKVIALLSNYGDALKYAEIAANSAGSAMQKFNESYMGSLEASQAQLQASFEALVIDTDFENVYADILEATKGIVDFVNEVNLLKGVASGLAVTGLIKAFAAFKTGAREAYISLNQYQQALILVNKTHISTNDFKRLLMLTKNLSASQTKLILSSKNLTLTQKKQLLINQGMSASEAKLHLQNLKLTTSYTGLKAGMVSVTNACKGLFNTIKANPLMLITTLISGVTMAWESYKQSVEEANERAITSAETAGELVSELSELTGKYLELSKAVETDESAKEDLLSTQDELLKKLDLEGQSIDTLVSKYGSLSEAIRQTSIDALRDGQIDLLAGIETARTELEEVGKSYEHWYSLTSRNILSSTGKDAGRAYQVLEDAGLMSSGSHTDIGGQFVLTGDDSVESILANYKLLEDALRALRESNEFTGEELTENPVYNQLHDRMKEMEEYVEQYKTLIDDYNNSLAQDTMLSSMGSMELPDTEDGFNKFREELIATAIESQKFIGTEEEIENAINAYLSTLPEFVGYYSGAVKAELDSVEDTLLSQDMSAKTSATITDSIKQIATQLEPQFSKLQDAYQSIFTLDDNGKEVFSLDEIDSSALEELRSTFAEIEEEVGVTFDTAQLEDFFSVLANGDSTAEEVQNAFNNIATSYLFSTDVLNSLNDATVNAIAKQLESLGVTNATAVATEVLAAKQEYLAQTGEELSNATAENINALIEQNAEITEEGIVLDSTTQKILAYWIQKQAANGQLSTVGDIQQLDALCEGLGISTKALKNYIYFKKLASMTDVYDADTIAIYAENAEKQMKQAQEDLQSIYAGFGGTTVDYSPIDTDKASKSAKDTTETFNWIERAVEDIESEISQLDKVVDSTFSTVEAKNKALVDQIGLINKEIELQQQAYEGYMAKAESVGLSDKYKNLVQSGAINIEDITDEDLQKAIKLYQDYYDKAQDALEKISDLHEEAMQKHVDGYELEADELKRKLDTQSITEKQYIDDMLVLWERYYENQVEYAEVAKNKKLDILAEEKSYLEKVANAAASILDYEINKLEEQKENAVKGYKAEIEVYEEKIDAVEAQIEVIEEQVDVIEEKRDALQDTLDNLEKQRTKEQEILNLQKAQYELERAKTQRTKLQYQDGQIKYVTDDSAIKTAREELDEAEFTITKRGIQDQIDNYDSQIDGLNKQVDGLNKVIDGYNKQIDKLNVLIDKSDAYYDGEIANLEKIKNEWTKALEIEQRAIDIRNFTDQFGEGAISRLISGDMSLVNEWKQSYLDTLEEIDLTSQGKVGAITEKFAELAGVDLTNAANQAKGVTSEIEALTDSVNDASTAIAGASSGNGEEPSKSKGEQSTSANSLVGAIDASYTTASEKLPAETEMMDGFTEATMSATEMMNGLTESTILATGEVDKLGEAINALPNEKTITIKIETQGSIPSVGGSSISSSSTKTSKVDGRPAHAEGTAKVTGDWGVREGGKTLVGELGQEIVVRGSRFFTVGDNGAEFVDLQKGDIVFNHLQSKELLSKGNIVGRGNALAEGTVLQKAELPSYLRPIQEGDKGYELIKAARVYQDMLKTNIMLPINSIDKNVEMMTRNISAVNTSNVNKPTLTINGGINVSCPGVNSQEIMNQVKTAMHREIGGIALEALQEASITR